MRYAALALGLLSLAILVPSPTEAGCGESDLNDDGVVNIIRPGHPRCGPPPEPVRPLHRFQRRWEDQRDRPGALGRRPLTPWGAVEAGVPLPPRDPASARPRAVAVLPG